jgi:hypothetical protein
MKERMAVNEAKLQLLLSSSGRVTICLDGWSKKGLSASFLGISACFFDPISSKPQHAFLNLEQIKHPHTGDMLSHCLEASLVKWGIPKEKILLVVTDNGANMVKAVRLLRERAQASEEVVESEVDEGSDDEDGMSEEGVHDEVDDIDLSKLNTPYLRMGCMVHTVQLVVKKAYDGPYKETLNKARALVGKVRKSSVIMEKIADKCGKVVVSDNATRWNSTYFMLKRLMEIRRELNEALADMNIDSLLIGEWAAVEELVELLEPFATHTDILQSDSLSLFNLIPSILDLDCHLDQFPNAKTLTVSMLTDLRQRCTTIFQPNHSEFNPIPAAACLLDPTCASFILGCDQSISELREAAKAYILNQVRQNYSSKLSYTFVFADYIHLCYFYSMISEFTALSDIIPLRYCNYTLFLHLFSSQ